MRFIYRLGLLVIYGPLILTGALHASPLGSCVAPYMGVAVLSVLD
jgi:hypothetical protein